MVEDTVLISATPDGDEELEVEILTDKLQVGENVREIGSDVALGSLVLQAGTVLSHTGGELGLLASVGCHVVALYRRPIVGVMSTGDEIVAVEAPAPLTLGQVRDSTRLAISSALKGWGHQVCDLGIVPDEPRTLETQLRAAFAQCDVVVTTGGASMGEHDLLKPVIERALGGTIHFARVAMKPGKPTTFATVELKSAGTSRRIRKLLFSLPGNPASAIVTTAVFVLPALRKIAMTSHTLGALDKEAWKRAGLPRVTAELTEAVRCDQKREEYVRVSVRATSDGRLHAQSTGGQRSSRIGSMAGANGLAVLPAGGGTFGEGRNVEVLLLSEVAW